MCPSDFDAVGTDSRHIMAHPGRPGHCRLQPEFGIPTLENTPVILISDMINTAALGLLEGQGVRAARWESDKTINMALVIEKAFSPSPFLALICFVRPISFVSPPSNLPSNVSNTSTENRH